jgi:hypothetical protein
MRLYGGAWERRRLAGIVSDPIDRDRTDPGWNAPLRPCLRTPASSRHDSDPIDPRPYLNRTLRFLCTL